MALCGDARRHFGEFRQEMKPVATHGNDRGRTERREYRLLPMASQLRKEWKGLQVQRGQKLRRKKKAPCGNMQDTI